MKTHPSSAVETEAVHPPIRQPIHPIIKWIALFAAFLFLPLLARWNFPLFHALTELAAAAVAWGVFLLVWNTREFQREPALFGLGAAYVFVGLLDLLHVFADPGMEIGLAPGYPRLGTRLWISARMLEAAGFLAFARFAGEPPEGEGGVDVRWIPYAGGGFLAAAAFLIQGAQAPIPAGPGRSGPEIAAGLAVCCALVWAAGRLIRKRDRVDPDLFRRMAGAMGLTLAAELAMIPAADPWGPGRAFGPLLKLASFFPVYRALIHAGVGRPIAQLHRELRDAARSLHAAEAEHRAVLDHLPDIVLVQDLEHRILYANATACESAGRPLAEIQGRFCHDIWGGHGPCADCPLADARKTGRVQQRIVESPDGRVWHVRGVPVSGAGGRVYRLVDVATELTEDYRKELRYRLILETAMDGFWIVDRSGRIREANAAAAAMLGDSLDGLIGRSVREVEAAATQAEIHARIERIAAEGSGRFQTRLRRRDGKIIDVSVSARYLSMDGGRIIAFLADVTGRKMLDDLRREQAALLDQISDAVIATDAGLRVTAWNAAATHVYGWTRDEALGRELDALLQTEFVGETREEARAAFASAGFWRGRVRQRDRSGRRLVVDASVSLTRGADGVPAGGVTVNRDVTGRVAAEERLKRGEERYRNLVEHSLQGIILLQAEPFRVSFASRRVYAILGRADLDLTGMGPEALITMIHPGDRERLLENLRLRLAGNANPTPHEYRFFRADGELRWLEAYSTRVSFEGEFAAQVALLDITERKRAEEALRRTQARYQAVVDDQTELICRFGPAGNLTFVNDSFRRFFGKTGEPLIGRNLAALIPEPDRTRARERFAALSAENPIAVFEHRARRPDGSPGWLEWTDRAILDESGRIVEYQGVGRDVTDLRRLRELLLDASERERRNLARELHDGLCQDLKSLEIEAALLEDRLAEAGRPEAEAAAAAGAGINAAVNAAYAVARGLLPAGLDAENFARALEGLAERIRALCGASVCAQIQGGLQPPDEPHAYHLFRIAQEAALNAARHSGAAEIHLEWAGRAGRLRLSVRDNGRGFGPAGVRPGGGVPDGPAPGGGGMGWAVMRSRARLLQADLEIRTAPGGGTEVCCTCCGAGRPPDCGERRRAGEGTARRTIGDEE